MVFPSWKCKESRTSALEVILASLHTGIKASALAVEMSAGFNVLSQFQYCVVAVVCTQLL